MSAGPADATTAAKQLEAFFMRNLLKEARPQGGMIDGGFAGDTFKGMLDEAIADKMTAAGGIGLAQQFAASLGATQEVPHSPGLADMSGQPPLAGGPQFMAPVAGRLGSGYGMRTDNHHTEEYLHKGVDLAAPTGTDVVASAPGTVVRAERAGTYGNLVTVRHANGYETRYAHLSAIGVKEGQHVDAGQHVGNVGSTGNSAIPHLHFEVRKGDQPIDPAQVLAPGALNRSPHRSNR